MDAKLCRLSLMCFAKSRQIHIQVISNAFNQIAHLNCRYESFLQTYENVPMISFGILIKIRIVYNSIISFPE